MFVLLPVEGEVFFAGNSGPGLGILPQESLYDAATKDGFGNNLWNVLCFHTAVKDILRFNNQDRAQFTKAVAAGLFYRYSVRQFPGLNFLAQGNRDLEGFSGPATSVADPNIFCKNIPLPENCIPYIF
jgi:hypothetical protein